MTIYGATMNDDVDLSSMTEDEQYDTILDTLYKFVDSLIDEQYVDPQLLGMAMIEMASYSMYIAGSRNEYEDLLDFGKTFEWPEDKPTLH